MSRPGFFKIKIQGVSVISVINNSGEICNILFSERFITIKKTAVLEGRGKIIVQKW